MSDLVTGSTALSIELAGAHARIETLDAALELATAKCVETGNRIAALEAALRDVGAFFDRHIEGAGYGGMSEYEIVRETIRRSVTNTPRTD